MFVRGVSGEKVRVGDVSEKSARRPLGRPNLGW